MYIQFISHCMLDVMCVHFIRQVLLFILLTTSMSSCLLHIFIPKRYNAINSFRRLKNSLSITHTLAHAHTLSFTHARAPFCSTYIYIHYPHLLTIRSGIDSCNVMRSTPTVCLTSQTYVRMLCLLWRKLFRRLYSDARHRKYLHMEDYSKLKYLLKNELSVIQWNISCLLNWASITGWWSITYSIFPARWVVLTHVQML